MDKSDFNFKRTIRSLDKSLFDLVNARMYLSHLDGYGDLTDDLMRLISCIDNFRSSLLSDNCK